MCAEMKIESIFWLSALKKDSRISSLVVEVDNAKMANISSEKELILDHILYRCMRYNPACRIKQYFNCYEYGHVSVHLRKLQSMKPAQAHIKHWNILEIGRKNAYCAMGLTHCGTKDASIGKKGILE